MLTPIRRWGLGLGVLLLLTALAAPQSATAQDRFTDKPASWWQELETQVTASLNSPVEQIQVESMQHIVFFATHYHDQVHFEEAVSTLLTIYETSPNARMRTLALMSLQATADQSAMERLAEVVQNEPSEQVARLTHAVLGAYYGG